MRILIAIVIASLVSACAPMTQRPLVDSGAAAQEAQKERQIAVQSLLSDELRLSRVSYPLLTHALPLCKSHVRYVVGMYAISASSFKGKYRQAAEQALKLGESPKVLQVIAGSPAQSAGFAVGDLITGVNGKPIATTSSEPGQWTKRFQSLADTGHSFTVDVLRGGKPLSLTVTAQPECDFPVTLDNSDALNAYADGHKVVIMRGMMRFAKNDDELALVISHELAHDAMGHIRKKEDNRLIGTFVDVLIAAVAHVNTQGAFGRAGSQAYSQQFESEADYVGLYIMARAGMPIDDAPNFWRRMAAAHPSSIQGSFSSSHPATPERMLALEKTVREIHDKQQEGLPLMPNMKKSESGS